MSDISELQQRVRDAGQRYGQLAEQDRQYGARLSSLLTQVEEGLARGRQEIDELKAELTRIQAENEQLKAMLQNLLAALENGGGQGLGTAMHELEGRINRLTETASAISDSSHAKDNDAVRQPGTTEPPEAIEAKPAESVPTKPPTADLEILATAEHTEPSEPTDASPDPDEPSGDGPPPRAADLVQLPDSPRKSLAEAPSDDDISTVNKIIQRISLLTGEFREADDKADTPPASQAAPEEEPEAEERSSQSG
ncbi:MAG: hypothetical protein V3R30_01720 [Kiloniellales bacterium]